MAAPKPEKLRHIAVCLPLLGLFLLMPPALLVFGIETTLADVPLIVIYLFGVWGGLIAGAAALSRHLDPRRHAGSTTGHERELERREPDRPAVNQDRST